jgi:hypothetical protein
LPPKIAHQVRCTATTTLKNKLELRLIGLLHDEKVDFLEKPSNYLQEGDCKIITFTPSQKQATSLKP